MTQGRFQLGILGGTGCSFGDDGIGGGLGGIEGVDGVLDGGELLGGLFGCGLGWLFDPAARPALFSLMLGQYLVKIVLAALDTIPFYLLTRPPAP